MKLIGWQKLFTPRILDRGFEYYESELVTLEAVDGHAIEATVEGTEPYSVEIFLKEGHVLQMECDCPYAAEGHNCKHMAAVLYAVDDTEYGDYSFEDVFLHHEQTERVSRDSELTKAVDALSEAQLRAFLYDAATEHPEIRDRILLSGKAALDPAMRKRWASDLRQISRQYADRSGFIDYRHASAYTEELDLYLKKTIASLIENHLTMDAFDLVGKVFSEVVSQDMDDSDGGLSLTVSGCEAYWKELISAPGADQKKMLRWFQSQIQRFSGEIGEEFLWPVVFEHFTDPVLLPEITSLLDEKIAAASEYALPRLINQRIELMKRIKATDEEINIYRRKFWALPFIRNQELDRLEAEEKWQETLLLLQECEQLDREDTYRI